ncbi:hypothetical protein B0O79_1436 [Flavobacteriaceae bacterium MAR_2009_75]|nr:hypothetical protein B0O79_1436 [Flavobacteriaceae bacterium MAR_2009_75]
MKQIVSIYLVLSLLIVGCSSGDDNPPMPSQEPVGEVDEEGTTINNPESVTLVFPFQASECEEGTDITENESTVTFEWQKADYTDSYELVIKNLNTYVQERFTATQENMAVRLKRGVPYEWYIISKSNSVNFTENSEVWRFYNQGSGTQNHVPFPAEVVSPENNGEHNFHIVDLVWSGSDVDNDIMGYDIYFGIQNPPVHKLADNTPNRSVTNIQVSVATYYWYIVTRDSAGNESESQIYSFIVR